MRTTLRGMKMDTEMSLSQEKLRLLRALRDDGMNEAQIASFMAKVEQDIHQKAIQEMMRCGSTLEQAEALYREAQEIIAEQDAKAMLDMVRQQKGRK